jgi:hypothetical protein
MSLACEILEARKQAGLFGPARMPTGIYNSEFARTNWLRNQYAKTPPPKPAQPPAAPAVAQQFPAPVLEAKAKSLANTQQIQNVMQAVQRKGPLPPPAPTPQSELDARHATTVSALKAVEASRQRGSTPTVERGSTPTVATKAACLSCPALDVMRLRAA